MVKVRFAYAGNLLVEVYSLSKILRRSGSLCVGDVSLSSISTVHRVIDEFLLLFCANNNRNSAEVYLLMPTMRMSHRQSL